MKKKKEKKLNVIARAKGGKLFLKKIKKKYWKSFVITTSLLYILYININRKILLDEKLSHRSHDEK